MKRFLMPTTAPAAMKKIVFTILCVALLMLVAAPAWADQCSSPSVGVGAGSVAADTSGSCGVLITVFSVSGGTATAFTVTTVGSPYDPPPFGTNEDSLVGIQNSSGSALTSINLSSPSTADGGIFAFDGDGPCSFNSYSWCGNLGNLGYEGPVNTFTRVPTPCGFGTCYTSGTVNFTTAIPDTGSTWFALEGSPQSFGSISQTQTLQPGQQSIYPAGNDNSKWTPGNTSAGGELLTVTAVPILQSAFDTIHPPGFPYESCVPYKDFTDANNGVHTCIGFQTSCAQGTASTNDCSTLPYTVETNYDLPDDLPATGGPDFLVFHGQPCPPAVGSTAQSIFLEYSATRTDPKNTGGGSGVGSCFVATYTPGAPPISGTVKSSQFIGFQSPVSDTDLNLIKAGSTVPLSFQVFDASGSPMSGLAYCQGTGCTGNWVNLSTFPINPCPADNSPNTSTDLLPADNSGFKDLGGGNYQFLWKTVKSSRGCVNVVATFSFGLVVAPAQLGFKYH